MAMGEWPTRIPVTVDKSHITVLGEKLYAESIELIRELVNNAYDADATLVRVTVEPDRIEVADDGSGMDYEGLVQYFNIGSPGKAAPSVPRCTTGPVSASSASASSPPWPPPAASRCSPAEALSPPG